MSEWIGFRDWLLGEDDEETDERESGWRDDATGYVSEDEPHVEPPKEG